jgi:hypothetical protein
MIGMATFKVQKPTNWVREKRKTPASKGLGFTSPFNQFESAWWASFLFWPSTRFELDIFRVV